MARQGLDDFLSMLDFLREAFIATNPEGELVDFERNPFLGRQEEEPLPKGHGRWAGGIGPSGSKSYDPAEWSNITEGEFRKRQPDVSWFKQERD